MIVMAAPLPQRLRRCQGTRRVPTFPPRGGLIPHGLPSNGEFRPTPGCAGGTFPPEGGLMEVLT